MRRNGYVRFRETRVFRPDWDVCEPEVAGMYAPTRRLVRMANRWRTSTRANWRMAASNLVRPVIVMVLIILETAQVVR